MREPQRRAIEKVIFEGLTLREVAEQTGETYKGQPLIDKQHPHDRFMELSAQYTHPLGERGTWFTYFGYPGEPALGPVAFMHRMSASENPSATAGGGKFGQSFRHQISQLPSLHARNRRSRPHLPRPKELPGNRFSGGALHARPSLPGNAMSF